MAMTPFGRSLLSPWGVGSDMDVFDPMSNALMQPSAGMPMSVYGRDLLNYPRARTDQLMRDTRQEITPFSPILSTDFYETDTDFHVHCDLPGVSENDLDVTVQENMLIIKAERRHAFVSDSDVMHRSERTFGRVQRTIPIPVGANTANANARFNNGVLEISFPKLTGGMTGRKLLVSSGEPTSTTSTARGSKNAK